MAKFEDYVKARKEQEEKSGLEQEIEAAGQQQVERETSTPESWEQRYKELEKHNSRQAQELGTLRKEAERYRSAFDEYILGGSTPAGEADSQESKPITADDIYENPDEAVKRAVDSHPAIKKAAEAEVARQQEALKEQERKFREKHGNFETTISDPAFADWLKQDQTRIDLAQRANGYDFSAADALFSLYEADQKIAEATSRAQKERELQQATLEAGGVSEAPGEVKYSRTDMREYMIKARQGDSKAQRYLDTHLPKYREALASGNVRD